MSPKKGDPVAAPTIGDEWEIRFGTKEAADGWTELVGAARGNARRAHNIMRTAPGMNPDSRHHQLKHGLATANQAGRVLPQWQIEVTGGGRVWYLLDQDHHTVWIRYASLSHPKATE